MWVAAGGADAIRVRDMLRRCRSVVVCGLASLVACAPPTGPGATAPPRTPDGTAAAPVVAAAPAVAEARADATLVPRSVLFGNPDRESPALSPDGKQLAYVAPVDGVLNVWVGPVDRPEAAKPVTQDVLRGIKSAWWSAGGDRVLYVQDRGGDENWHMYAVDPASGQAVDLTPYPGVRAQLEGISDRRPNEVLIGMNDRDPAWHDLYRVDLKTGKRTLVHENAEKLAGYVTDEDYKPRFADRAQADGGVELLVLKGKQWAPVFAIGQADAMTTTPLDLDEAGKTLYLFDSRGRETAALVAYDVKTGKTTVLAEDPKAGVGGLLVDRKTHRPLAAAFTHLRQAWKAIDKDIAGDLAALAKVADGDFNVVSQSRDDSKWVVQYKFDDGPNRYYVYDRASKQATLLFTADAELAAQKLAKMHPVVIRARDKLELVTYYTLPPGSDPDGDGVPSAPLPTVLLVHGGPWGRDTWGFAPTHQWLASRGYAVMSVNFRGSTGFTKSFVNAGDKEWAAKMHDDLLDAVGWAEHYKIAARGRVAIMGGSYGGYATLVGLTFTPEAFACGVDIVGPSNLETLMRSIPPYWASIAAMFATRMGDIGTAEGRKLLYDRSPLHRVDAIKRPLLIGQGANDPRVKQPESDQIVAAMQAKRLPVTYVLYPDEGHGFQRPENKISFNAIAEAFLAGCLGGAYQPIGDDLKDSSLQVKAGAEHVPGLADALKAAGK